MARPRIGASGHAIVSAQTSRKTISDKLADAQLETVLLRKRLSNMERTIKVDNERLERRMKELEEEHAELGERVKDLEDTIVMMKTAREEYLLHLTELTQMISAAHAVTHIITR